MNSASIRPGRRPGKWVFVLATIAALLGITLIALESLVESLGDFLAEYWVIPALVVGVALLAWRMPLQQVLGIVRLIGGVFRSQPVRGISIGVVLTVVYGGVALVGYYIVLPWMQIQLGAGWRFSLLVAVVATLAAMFPLFLLYRATGFPGDGENVKRAAKWFAVIAILLFVGFTAYRPNYFFDPLSKKPLFMVDEAEDEPYFIPPETCAQNGGCVSPLGEPLRPGTPADARQFAELAWPKQLMEWLEEDGDDDVVHAPADSRVCGETVLVAAPTGNRWSEVVHESGDEGIRCRWSWEKLDFSAANMRGLIEIRPDGNDGLVQKHGFLPDGEYVYANFEELGDVDTLEFRSLEHYPIELSVFWRPS